MNKLQAKKRIEKLKKTITRHRYLYHVLDRQEISDSALDSLKKELFDLEKEFPEFITPDSPTQRIGGRPLDKFEKVKHKTLMLSFNDAFSKQDMKDWLERISKLLSESQRNKLNLSSHYSAESGTDDGGFYCELKIDGLAVELVYEKGILKIGSTRGDGKIGENITQNLKTIEAIPLILRNSNLFNFPNQIIVRGEVFISKNEFEKVNKEREKAKEPVYANPRNLAAGSLRQLDPKITAQRSLDFFAYDIFLSNTPQHPPTSPTTHEQKHKILKELGFKVNPYNKFCRSLNEVFDFYEKCQKLREKLDYEIDGLVVLVNSNEIFEKLGVVGKASRGSIAFKFPAKQSTTIVEDIKVQVGRTGALTPVAYLKPVRIGGAMVSRATLHNEDEIKRLGVKIGDTVIVSRAGDVIPDVVKVLKELRDGREKEFKMPNKCPVCGSRTERKKGEAVYYCLNPNCFAVQKRFFYHFVSKSAFDIEGLGPKIIDKLINAGLVLNPADLFKLQVGDIIPLKDLPRGKPLLSGFAEKSAENLIKAINNRKEITLPRFIYSLSIRNVGLETAYELAEEFGSLENLKKVGPEKLERVKDIGPISAKSIYDWFHSERNLKFLEKLKKASIRIMNYESRIMNKKLKGKIFVLTGELESLTRNEAKEKIRQMGGDVSDSVSKKTNFVVVGKEPGSKYDKAKKLGIKIINEKEFLKMI